jgi:hypothetical protein
MINRRDSLVATDTGVNQLCCEEAGARVGCERRLMLRRFTQLRKQNKCFCILSAFFSSLHAQPLITSPLSSIVVINQNIGGDSIWKQCQVKGLNREEPENRM